MNQPPWGAPPTQLDQYTQPGQQAYGAPWGAYPMAPYGMGPAPMGEWAAGDMLVVPLYGAQFPPLCPKTGEPTQTTLLVKLQWQPQWVFALLLLGVLPFAIVSMMMQKRAQILFPMSPRIISRRRLGFVVGISSFFLFLAMVIGGAAAQSAAVALLSFPVLIGGLIYMGITTRLFRVVKITDQFAIIRDVAPSYLQNFPQGPLPPL